MLYAAWSLFAVLALADWVAVARGSRRLEMFFKPAATIALLAVPVAAVVWGDHTTRDVQTIGGGDLLAVGFFVSPWLFVALGFGLLGDVFLLSDSVARFKAGLAAFLVGHLAYLAAFHDTGASWSRFIHGFGGAGPWLFAALMLAALAFTRGVLPAVWASHGPSLAVPVAAYTLVIGAMLGFAFATGLGLVALGGAIFVASDSLLARDRFVAPLPRGHLLVMITYLTGQALIVAGLIG